MALINDFLSLIYPRKCESCTQLLFKHEKLICNYCKISLPRSDFHNQPHNSLGNALAGRIPFLKAAAYFIFEKKGRVQRLLHAVKYQNQQSLAVFLGREYAGELGDYLNDIDLLIPIPLHTKKEKKRGYNQSALFARGLSEVSGIKMEAGILKRQHETDTQTRKRKFERWENVDGIFSIDDKFKMEGKHVMLVDDVITTGATLEAAWQALKEVKGIRVSVLAIAFASR